MLSYLCDYGPVYFSQERFVPIPERDYRYQGAVLWEASGSYNEFGRPTVGSPSSIQVRWELKQEEALAPDGTKIAVDGFVVVDQVVPVHSLLWLADDQGEGAEDALEQWYGSGSAGDTTEVMEVVTYSDVPDVKGRRHRRVCGVKRYGDSLPS